MNPLGMMGVVLAAVELRFRETGRANELSIARTGGWKTGDNGCYSVRMRIPSQVPTTSYRSRGRDAAVLVLLDNG
jgi:hypothetical protein